MNLATTTIIPITKARGKLGDLADGVKLDQVIILTKGGSPKAALVNPLYLEKLQQTAEKLTNRTFLDPKLLPYTRLFSDEETTQWEAEDRLE